MKGKALKKLITLALFIVFVTTFSSCNRGYGCPNNFSIGDTVNKVVKVVQTATNVTEAIAK